MASSIDHPMIRRTDGDPHWMRPSADVCTTRSDAFSASRRNLASDSSSDALSRISSVML